MVFDDLSDLSKHLESSMLRKDNIIFIKQKGILDKRLEVLFGKESKS